MKEIPEIPKGKLLTAEEVAEILGCNVATVRGIANKGGFPFARRLKRMHVFVSDGLSSWLSDPSPPGYKPVSTPVIRRRRARAA